MIKKNVESVKDEGRGNGMNTKDTMDSVHTIKPLYNFKAN
ncbi:hypothetical protein [Bacillus phage PK16]|nr:hypothetical protein [Bacillus phage PK16]